MQGCTSLQTDNHASTTPLGFLQARCPSCHPTNSVKALKAVNGTKIQYRRINISLNNTQNNFINLQNNKTTETNPC